MLDKTSQELVARIEANCRLLYEGYNEKVEYTLDVAYHGRDCRYHGKSTRPKDCTCPVEQEQRVRSVRRPGYLDQLRAFAEHKDTDRNPKAERGAPRVKTAGRPPGDMGGFFALDELECEIPAVVDRFLVAVGGDRAWGLQSARLLLIGLSSLVREVLVDLALGGGGAAAAGLDSADSLDSTMIDSVKIDDLARDDHGVKINDHETPLDHARRVDLAAARWVDLARSTLKINVSNAIFDKIVCGNCGGALSTPHGNRGDHDVRCIGTPTDPPCGETYPPGEWLALYEDHQRRKGRS